MKWEKIASMEYGKIVIHSIPCHALSTTQVKQNSLPSKLGFFFILNTISCFILSRNVEAEAVEAFKFLRKRKYFDKRDWKRKRTWKQLILSGAGSGSEKFQR